MCSPTLLSHAHRPQHTQLDVFTNTSPFADALLPSITSAAGRALFTSGAALLVIMRTSQHV
jgi:hypothetical protein